MSRTCCVWTFWVLSLGAALGVVGPAQAAAYTENFDSGTAAGWAPLAGTWSLTGGTYVETAILASAFTVYGSSTWATGYTYEASVLNQFTASGNKAGLVYNYVDASNYYAITIAGNTPSTVTLTKVVAGVTTTTTAPGTVAGPNTWYVIDVIRSGTNTTINIGGVAFFTNVSQPELGAGKIGFIATNTNAKFDTVNVVDADTTAPTAPTSPSATAASSTQINLSWTASSDNVGVSGYRVERCSGASCSAFVQIATPTATSYSDTGLTVSTSYSYRIRAADAAGNLSAYSTTASATTQAAPAGYFEDFNAGTAAGWSPVAGTWSLTGGVYAETAILASGITLYGSSTWSTNYTYTASVFNQFTASGNKAGLIYNYVDANNYYYITIAGNTPSTVMQTKVIAGVSTSTTSASTVAGPNAWYVVDVIRSGTLTTIKIGGVAFFTNISQPELGAGKIGFIATNTNAKFDNVSVTSNDATAPTSPSGLTTTAISSGQINLSWTASTDNVGVTGYLVERCTGTSCTAFAQVATPTTTTYSDTGLTGSTSYSYRVRATDAAGNVSSYSNISTASTLAAGDTTPPTAPSSLTATVASSSQVNLSWTGSTDNVGVTNYLVEQCQGVSCTTFAQIATAAGVTLINTGLTASTSYSYRVRATDAAGNLSSYSNTATATTQTGADTTPPTAPSALSATASSSTQINLSWTASTDNVGVTNYVIERCQGASCTNYTQIATAAGTTLSNAGLTASTSYSYRVRATDAAGNLSSYSNFSTAVTLAGADTTPPSAPTNLIATPMPGAVGTATVPSAATSIGGSIRSGSK